MKNKNIQLTILILSLFFVSFTFVGCNDDDDDPTPDKKEYDYTSILTDYTNKTIIATYADMKDNAKMLYQKSVDFKNSNSQEDLDAACEYWVKTRKPWEASEAYLFGPAAYNNLDPLLDSWPLDRDQLQQVLDGDAELTADYVRDGLGAVLRGFHTVEFLIFREGDHRNAADISDREKEYLVAVSQVLRDDCVKLWAAWEGGESEQDILDEIEFEVAKPYGEEFINAGKAGSRYNSQTDAIDELLQGAIGIADEVGNAKISDPHNSNEVLDVESWFSWNSLTDFQNNIRSIENAYLGGYNPDDRGASIADLVKEKNPSIDTEMREAIDEAIKAIDAIPHPFRNNLKHENVPIAIGKVNELQTILEEKVRPLFVD